MHLHRALFKNEVLAEFIEPHRPSDKVIILCDGMPTLPAKKHVALYWSQRNYWVFHPRYRGSWESKGTFLEKSPHIDILDVIDSLPKGFKSIWTNQTFKVKPSSIIIMGSSFGGAASLLASTDKRVTKSIALSPVVDWTVPSPDEPLDHLYEITKKAFGNGYRMNKKLWNKLSSGTFFNPIAQCDKMEKNKIYIISTKDDTIIPTRSVQTFQKCTSCKHTLLTKGGHLSLSQSITPRFSRWINSFITS